MSEPTPDFAGTARQTDMQDTAEFLLRDFCEGKHAANEP